MIMSREYYQENIDMVVEMEDEEGYRDREVMKESAVTAYVNKRRRNGDYLCDIDFCCKQTDEAVKHFLNVVFYNWEHNTILADKVGSVWNMIDLALDNWDYA